MSPAANALRPRQSCATVRIPGLRGVELQAPVEKLRSAAARFRLGHSRSEAIISEAADLLSEMLWNQPLAELAGSEPSSDVVEVKISRALEAEGYVMPTITEAGRIVARDIAFGILNGDISPQKGARFIWWEVVGEIPELEDELGHFAGLASEWEDDTVHRLEYEEDIRRAAAELLEG